ncbi:MAG: UMP kinase [Bacteroidales bacterium]|nr:UMP kinase [Bacteroidales bacterium]
MIKYKRVLLKLSGEALMGKAQNGIDETRLNEYASQIKKAVELGAQAGIVIGGGNIFRGVTGLDSGIDRVRGDYMGMLATVINGLAIQSALERQKVRSRLISAINMEPVAERYSKRRVMNALAKGEVVIFTFGTGNPYFTTDTTAALRGIEMEADIILKGTRVDGVYTADPEKDRTAVKFTELTFDEAYEKGLKIMDLTAFTMCSENNMPIIVFDMNQEGNLVKIIQGEKVGTLIKT